MRNDRRKNPPRDPNNNPEKTLTDVIAREAVQRNHEGKAPDPAENDDLEYLSDTNSTDDSKSGSCMEGHGDEEWVRDYEETEEQNHGMEEGDKTTVGPPGIGEQMPLLTYSSSDTDSGRRKRIQHTHGCSRV